MSAPLFTIDEDCNLVLLETAVVTIARTVLVAADRGFAHCDEDFGCCEFRSHDFEEVGQVCYCR